jgi:hypothetical protein
VAGKVTGPVGQAQMAGLLPGESPDNPVEQEPEFHHAAGFFNQPWVQNLLPFATSLVFHLGILLVGFLVWGIAVKTIGNPNKEQVVIPEAKTLGAAKMPGGTPHPGPMADPTRDLAQMETKDVKDDTGLDTHADSAMHDTAGKAGDNAKYGIGASGHTGNGNGKFGNGAGGSPAPYGTPGGGDGGHGPKSSIYGTGGSANNIVFLVDTSGSMIGVFGDVKANLKKSILSLPFGRGQFVSFDIITFSDEKEPRIFSKSATGKKQLMINTAENVKKAVEFIDDSVASGGTIPMPAIQAALSESPRAQLIYVMTDGFDNVASFDDVINAFKEGTKDGYTHVNCIHFVAEPDPKLVQVLTDIAKNGQGEFKQVQKSDMQ